MRLSEVRTSRTLNLLDLFSEYSWQISGKWGWRAHERRNTKLSLRAEITLEQACFLGKPGNLLDIWCGFRPVLTSFEVNESGNGCFRGRLWLMTTRIASDKYGEVHVLRWDNYHESLEEMLAFWIIISVLATIWKSSVRNSTEFKSEISLYAFLYSSKIRRRGQGICNLVFVALETGKGIPPYPP